jgi:vitamin-K-epoxide reductase (warfarin-sensitive)
MWLFIILAVLGFGISFYTYLLEQKLKEQSDYKAACDLADWASCTKPIKSSYANIFYFSNAVVGMLFYILVIIFSALGAMKLLFFASLAACLASAVLAYLLYFKIKSLCILCTSLYLINVILLILAIHAW